MLLPYKKLLRLLPSLVTLLKLQGLAVLCILTIKLTSEDRRSTDLKSYAEIAYLKMKEKHLMRQAQLLEQKNNHDAENNVFLMSPDHVPVKAPNNVNSDQLKRNKPVRNNSKTALVEKQDKLGLKVGEDIDIGSVLYGINLTDEESLAVSGSPSHFLSEFKNPCWLSRLPSGSVDPYKTRTRYGDQRAYKAMRELFTKRAKESPDLVTRVRCLPLVYLIGVTKSGTTDLYDKMNWHPDVHHGATKEPMYWNMRRLSRADAIHKPISEYLDLYDNAGEKMSRSSKQYKRGVTVDASPNYLWNYDGWTHIPANNGLTQPKVTLAHTIHQLVPSAKIILILRNPTDRLYSQFRMWSPNHTTEFFHAMCVPMVGEMKKCLANSDPRYCVYHLAPRLENRPAPLGMKGPFRKYGLYLRASIYYPFIADWLNVFPRDQIKVVRGEDYYVNRTTVLNSIFHFLKLGSMSAKRISDLESASVSNSRDDHHQRSSVDMLPKTRRLLDTFFMPLNNKLADLLSDSKYRWPKEETARH